MKIGDVVAAMRYSPELRAELFSLLLDDPEVRASVVASITPWEAKALSSRAFIPRKKVVTTAKRTGRPPGNGAYEHALLKLCIATKVPVTISAFVQAMFAFTGKLAVEDSARGSLRSLHKRGAIRKLRCRTTDTIKWWHPGAGDYPAELFDTLQYT